MQFVLPIAVVIAILVGGYFAVVKDQTRRARFVKKTAIWFMGVFALFAVPFIAGEILTDPGGWRGGGLVAAWLVPMLVLSALAWYRPGWSVVILSAATAGVVAMSVWYAMGVEPWRSYEESTGPVRAIAGFALTVPLVVLGWKRTTAAAIQLIIVGVVPILLSAAASGMGWVIGVGSLAAVSAPAMVTGALYLVAAVIMARGERATTRYVPGHPAGTGRQPPQAV